MSIVIYTDGGCEGNPGPGGWAFIMQTSGRERESSGSEPQTTNNRMELTAVIRALEAVSGDAALREDPIELHTDSQYVQRGMSEWIARWIRSGWKTASKEPVKNQDLWKRLHSLSGDLEIAWRWVKGHDGNELNERCDRLVRAAIASAGGG